jgi:hypothetical protein
VNDWPVSKIFGEGRETMRRISGDRLELTSRISCRDEGLEPVVSSEGVDNENNFW